MKLGSLWFCVLIATLFFASTRVAGQSNSTDDDEIVADVNGKILHYGPNNIFNIQLYNGTSTFVYGFYFGLGEPDDEVETNTPLSLGVVSPSSLIVCQNGTGNSGFQGSTPPDDGLFIIRENTTFGFYTLHLANTSSTGIQFGVSTKPIFSCTPNAASTPIQFVLQTQAGSPPSSSSSLSPFLPLLFSLVALCLIFASPLSF